MADSAKKTCTCCTFAIHRGCPEHGWMVAFGQNDDQFAKNPLQPTPVKESEATDGR